MLNKDRRRRPPNVDEEHGHVHDHSGITSCNDRHCHSHPGVTGTPIPRGRTHYHEIVGATTYQDGHFHTYRANTGPAVDLPDGNHTHQVSFSTSVVEGHRHTVMGFVMSVRPEENHHGVSDWDDAAFDDTDWEDDSHFPFQAEGKSKKENE